MTRQPRLRRRGGLRLRYIAPLVLLSLAAFVTTGGRGRSAEKGAEITISADFPVTFVSDPRPHTLGDVAGAKGTALIFMATECPISKRYIPEIGALSRMYAPQGIRLIAVYANAGTTAQEAIKQVGMGPLRGMPVLLDAQQKLADKIGATVTPEVAVLDKDFILRYKGRIDNGFAARGIDRAAGANARELRDALFALAQDKPVTAAAAPAVGCAIERARIVAANGPTYAANVAPILQKNCVSCHREGEIAPMPLISYEDAKRWAMNIAEVTGTRFMPPWKPVQDHGRFVGERRLTDAQRATLKKWAEAGCPPGDLQKTPPLPIFPQNWQLGKPDMILRMAEPWRVDPKERDAYRCFVLPTNLTEDKDIVAVEYRAGNGRVVQRLTGYLDTQRRARKRDAANFDFGYAGVGGVGFAPDGELGGWSPGDRPAFLPDGVARLLPAGSDIVLQVHYHTDGHAADDVTLIGLYFAKKPAQKRLRVLPIGVPPLDIPAGKSDYTVSRTVKMPMNARVLWVAPQISLLGKRIEMTATLSDGKKIPLIKISDWDFRWQGAYTFREPLTLPKGTSITVTAVYDNSENNPRNPHSPPQRIVRGEETTEEREMVLLGFVAENKVESYPPLFNKFP